MRMKNHLSSFGKMLAMAFCTLSMGGLMYSCSDDYDLPDKTPSWLGSSIYDYLKSKGNFTNTVNLIDDLSYTEVLAKTGSKTLFVADDDAYERFYANNLWGVRKYSDLTLSQKKLLLNSAMLDNAYLLEMMANTTASTENKGSWVNKNVALKQRTSLSATDTIPHFNAEDLPVSYNPNDVDYWARFRDPEKGGIYMACDATVPLMVHWINGQMENMKMTDEDFETVVGRPREKNDVFISGSKIVKQDITCQNGYINQVEEVMDVPTNLAEMMRQNHRTKLFSHMLDRFCAPYYNSELTNAYRQINPNVDSVFEKRYISEWSHGTSNRYAPDDKVQSQQTEIPYYLAYDPGWNTYYPYTTSSATATSGLIGDMAAIFVPDDNALLNYFSETGGGGFLMERYAVELPVTAENLMRNVDQIPQNVIQAFINNLMKESFSSSLPSKYTTITNDARDPMFGEVSNIEEYKAMIDTCLIAANGVAYVMNKTFTPATYACVAAPALVNDTLSIFNWAINVDEPYGATDPANAPLKAFMSIFLRAMNSTFSFFIPSDNALKAYYDPVSMAYAQPYALEFKFEENLVTARAKRYDAETGELADNYMMKAIRSEWVNNRLVDLMNAHTIVHDTAMNETHYINSGKEYYLSRDGAPVRVINPELGANGAQVQGGWQIDNNQYCNITRVYDKTRETNGYGNGMTYIIDRPLQSTTKSVYSILYDNGNEDSPYSMFFDLCQVDRDVLDAAGFANAATTRAEKERVLGRYDIFTSNNPCLDYNVRSFKTYYYTVFIPTNDAVQQAISKGLPTWSSIADYIEAQEQIIAAHENDTTFDAETFKDEYQAKAQAMATELINFCKYHFMDNSVFADVPALPTQELETACINTETNRYITLTVESLGNRKLRITDAAGKSLGLLEGGNVNMLSRDLQFDNTGSNANLIETSSFAVLHQIDGVLDYKALTNGRYDSDWATARAAKNYLKKYAIK